MANGYGIPILLTLVIGFRLEQVMVDILHAIDLGLSQHIIANVFWLIAVIRSVYGGSTQKQKIEGLQEKLNEWNKDTKNCRRMQG